MIVLLSLLSIAAAAPSNFFGDSQPTELNSTLSYADRGSADLAQFDGQVASEATFKSLFGDDVAWARTCMDEGVVQDGCAILGIGDEEGATLYVVSETRCQDTGALCFRGYSVQARTDLMWSHQTRYSGDLDVSAIADMYVRTGTMSLSPWGVRRAPYEYLAPFGSWTMEVESEGSSGSVAFQAFDVEGTASDPIGLAWNSADSEVACLDRVAIHHDGMRMGSQLVDSACEFFSPGGSLSLGPISIGGTDVCTLTKDFADAAVNLSESISQSYCREEATSLPGPFDRGHVIQVAPELYGIPSEETCQFEGSVEVATGASVEVYGVEQCEYVKYTYECTEPSRSGETCDCEVTGHSGTSYRDCP